jgi:hypothetical protein
LRLRVFAVKIPRGAGAGRDLRGESHPLLT